MKPTNKNLKNAKNAKSISKGGIIAIVSMCALIAAVIIVLLVEAMYTHKIVFENNTGRNIEEIKVYFEADDDTQFDTILEGSIAAGEKLSNSYGSVNMGLYDAEMVVLVTFEGGETIGIYDGEFSGVYKGRVTGEFFERDGEYYFQLKAGVGLGNSTDLTFCDTEFILDTEAGDWDYSDEDGDYSDEE